MGPSELDGQVSLISYLLGGRKPLDNLLNVNY